MGMGVVAQFQNFRDYMCKTPGPIVGGGGGNGYYYLTIT